MAQMKAARPERAHHHDDDDEMAAAKKSPFEEASRAAAIALGQVEAAAGILLDRLAPVLDYRQNDRPADKIELAPDGPSSEVVDRFRVIRQRLDTLEDLLRAATDRLTV